MINSTQNNLLNQMQALEAMAKNQLQQVEIKTEQSPSFGELMQLAVNEVNQTQMQASSLTRAFELGENVDLSQIMIAVNKLCEKVPELLVIVLDPSSRKADRRAMSGLPYLIPLPQTPE